MGYDLDAIAGYDFGMFRLEGEIGYKHTKINDATIDGTFVTGFGSGLNPPCITGTGITCVDTAFVDSDFDITNKVSVLSGMLNALLDFGNEDGFSFYAGGGFGRARVKALGDSDSAWAWQGIAGVRYAISPNIDLGLKYRYFRTGDVDLFAGSTARRRRWPYGFRSERDIASADGADARRHWPSNVVITRTARSAATSAITSARTAFWRA